MEEHQRDRLGQSEHEEELLYNISKNIVNRNYIQQNQDFWDIVFFKMFEEYYYGLEPVSIKQQAKCIEIMMYNLFKYQPSLELPDDILML